MKRSTHIAIAAIILLPGLGFAQSGNFSLQNGSKNLLHLTGKKEKATYPYVTAGSRLYAIGDQAGNFPSIGFHVEGEMGGVWQQPIKLLDGFRLTVADAKNNFKQTLAQADSFITYPFTSAFVYQLQQENITVTRTQFVPDDLPVLVVEYTFKNTGNYDKNLQLAFNADVNLMPVWLGERSGMIDSTDEVFSFNNKTLLLKDKNNTWYTGITSDNPNTQFTGSEKSPYKGKGITGVLSSSIHIAKGNTTTIRFYISGSIKNTTEITSNLSLVQKNLQQLFAAKQKRYAQLDNTASINIPDKQIMQAYQWGKYSSDWLVRDVPGLGRGMSAGLPDYPWFFSNDQAFTFNALVGTVKPDIFYQSWKMLAEISAKTNGDNGRVIHEASTNGVAYDKGRMEESQLHIITAWNIYRWTGNLTFLKEHYEHGQRIWKWLQEHDTDHNSYIEGYGGVEIEGLNDEMLDVQVYTQHFLEVMGHMASAFNDAQAAADYEAKATALKVKINADWWTAGENRYADFISSKEKAIQLIDMALEKRVHIGRNEWARKKLTSLKEDILAGKYADKGYNVFYNTSGILPLEEGIADTAKALAALQHVDFFTNKYGLYITGIERPDDLSIDEGSFQHDKEFNYNRAVMPAATTNLMIAQCRYGSPDTALRYIYKILNSFSYATPGTTYEVSPDYGMFVQAWNIRAFNIPIIQYFFGIDPLAAKKIVNITPDMPNQWNYANIKNVLISSNKLSVDYKKTNARSAYTIASEEAGWKVNFKLPKNATNVTVNGKAVTVANSVVILAGIKNVVEFE
ncbi:hypothetical protein ACI6Q2_10715 [Chitinophagaceae bacterium LWZ2-11]